MSLALVRRTLSAGGVAIVPTDTVYGLAAALDSPAGVAALYALKGRPRSQPCQVLVYTAGLLDEAIEPLDAVTAAAVRAVLPGRVTCIVPDPAGRYRSAGGAQQAGSVGIRAPSMNPAVKLGVPLIATSANEPGEPDPVSVDDVPERIRATVGATLDLGPLPGRASTVVDLTSVGAGGPARVLREGDDVQDVLERLEAIGVPVASGSV
jgi:tRNA threonylcarbamoyl adenosine modification protein (Sua5/YciO/YrdC/YwlC family)